MSTHELAIKITLAGMPDDAAFQVQLPHEAVDLSLNELLEELFPVDEAERLAWEESFDLAVNPDLPEIYDAFLAVIDQFRQGLCRLTITGEDRYLLKSEDAVASLVPAQPRLRTSSENSLALFLYPEYPVLQIAEAEGWDAGEPDLLDWLRTCTTMYFLDKHEAALPQSSEVGCNDALRQQIERIEELNLVAPANLSGSTEITPEGRRFIGSLLAETESYIDRYDLFKDVWWDQDTLSPEFGTGVGEDLRVSAFLLEGLDPVRTVFLLRLYDGTLDEFKDSWQEQMSDPAFFDQILQPVLNRFVVEEEVLEAILEEGFGLLEDLTDADREGRLRSRVLRRAGIRPS